MSKYYTIEIDEDGEICEIGRDECIENLELKVNCIHRQLNHIERLLINQSKDQPNILNDDLQF